MTPPASGRKTAIMLFRSAVVALGVVAVVAVGAAPSVWADQQSRLSEIAVKGGTFAVTVGDVEQRLRALPAFQLAALGHTDDEIRRAVVEKIVIPEAVFAAAAADKRLDQRPALRERIVDVMRSARLQALAAEVAASPSVGPEAQARYYQQNRAHFDSPERIAVWRILCPTRDDAARILEEVKTQKGLERWTEISRDRSIDKATAMRGGDLGFLSADGASSIPTVKVDPAIFAAASRVKDGTVVPDPVAESAGFAVVWRRSSVPATRRTLQEEAPAIRQLLIRQQVEQATKELVAGLQRTNKVEVHPELVDSIEIAPSANAPPYRRPGVVPVTPQGPVAPSATPRGLR